MQTAKFMKNYDKRQNFELRRVNVHKCFQCALRQNTKANNYETTTVDLCSAAKLGNNQKLIVYSHFIKTEFQ